VPWVGGWLMGGVLGAFAAVVLLRMVRGDIRLVGLLRPTPGDPISAERVQMLVVTLGVMGAYLLQVADSIAMVRVTHRLPEPSDLVLGAAGGSNAVFLALKTLRLGLLDKVMGR
jgi:hypothetical protein